MIYFFDIKTFLTYLSYHIISYHIYHIISVCVTAGLVTQDPNRELDIYQVYKTLCDAGYCSYSQRRHDFRTFFLGYLVKVQGIPHSCRVI